MVFRVASCADTFPHFFTVTPSTPTQKWIRRAYFGERLSFTVDALDRPIHPLLQLLTSANTLLGASVSPELVPVRLLSPQPTRRHYGPLLTRTPTYRHFNECPLRTTVLSAQSEREGGVRSHQGEGVRTEIMLHSTTLSCFPASSFTVTPATALNLAMIKWLSWFSARMDLFLLALLRRKNKTNINFFTIDIHYTKFHILYTLWRFYWFSFYRLLIDKSIVILWKKYLRACNT